MNESTLKRLAVRAGAAVAKKAAAALFCGIATALGVPVIIVVLCVVLGTTAFLAVFGSLPEQARNAPEWPGYVATAQQYRLPIQSEDGAEARFQVTPGLIMALDVLMGKERGEAFAEVADILLPQFSYKTETVTGTDPVTGQPFSRTVTLLRRATTFEGTTWLEYSCEMDGANLAITLEERFESDLSRAQAALERLTGEKVEAEMAQALVNLARSIDRGEPVSDMLGGTGQ